MKVILFAFYYIKLLLGVMLGFHQTLHPLDIRWRWNNWRYRYKRRE